MLRLVGYLVTMLALARFFAPVPSDVDADSAAPAPTHAPASPNENGNDGETPILRKVVFIPGVIDGTRAPADLRNPFTARKVKATGAEEKRRAKTTRVRHDLRDPFATKPTKQRLEPAPDLRDPFVRPKRSLPKCPDTGGVPIQRPDSIDPGCATASLRVILANR